MKLFLNSCRVGFLTLVLVSLFGCDKTAVYEYPLTYEDLDATWVTINRNGEEIPLQEAAFCEVIEQGKSVISYVENGTWVSKKVKLELKDNVISRQIGPIFEDFAILYFDQETIIWQSLKTGDVVTRKAVANPAAYRERILGAWNGEFADQKLIVAQDSMSVNGKQMAYRLYGDVLVVFNEKDPSVFMYKVTFGFDKERGEMGISLTSTEAVVSTYYKPNLENKLAGGWVWIKDGGEITPTSEFEISFYNPLIGKHDHQAFLDGGYQHVVESFEIAGNDILYPEDDEFPYETITTINDTMLMTLGCDDVVYEAVRIPYENPLFEEIVGEWYCAEFKLSDRVVEMTQTFEESGLVISSFAENGDNVYGTYQIYGRLLVMHFSENHHPVWYIKDGIISEDTMSWIRKDDDGNVVINEFTRM